MNPDESPDGIWRAAHIAGMDNTPVDHPDRSVGETVRRLVDRSYRGIALTACVMATVGPVFSHVTGSGVHMAFSTLFSVALIILAVAALNPQRSLWPFLAVCGTWTIGAVLEWSGVIRLETVENYDYAHNFGQMTVVVAFVSVARMVVQLIDYALDP